MPGPAGEVDCFRRLTDMLENQSHVAQRILQTISKFLITHSYLLRFDFICVPRARGSFSAGIGSFHRINLRRVASFLQEPMFGARSPNSLRNLRFFTADPAKSPPPVKQHAREKFLMHAPRIAERMCDSPSQKRKSVGA